MNILRPGAGVIYMKVGTHADEALAEIVRRKAREIKDAGFALWGYGGGTCHPQTAVQPFARSYQERGEPVYLCMHPMESRHFARPVRAAEFSVDGAHWQAIHPAINVLGSRYALAIKGLREERFVLPLAATQVAVGNSRGKAGDRYVGGRVDKACLRVVGPWAASALPAPTAPAVEDDGAIELVAELVAPFAVHVR